MIKRIIKAICFFVVICSVRVMPDIIIRPGIQSDIAPALALDYEIMMEYFKPLFINYYGDMPLGKNPDYYLGLDFQYDTRMFADCVNLVGCERLYVAFDQELRKVAGFIAFHKDRDTTGEIDLLLINKEYRRMGIGKKLIAQAIASMKPITFCGVYVFSQNREALKFYYSYGFKDLGLGPKAEQKIYPGIFYRDVLVYLGMPING